MAHIKRRQLLIMTSYALLAVFVLLNFVFQDLCSAHVEFDTPVNIFVRYIHTLYLKQSSLRHFTFELLITVTFHPNIYIYMVFINRNRELEQKLIIYTLYSSQWRPPSNRFFLNFFVLLYMFHFFENHVFLCLNISLQYFKLFNFL